MANKIQLKRGLKSRLTTLSAGEPAFVTDTRELFVGTGSGNVNMSGSKWYNGTALSGTAGTTGAYSYSACPLVKLGDMYLNTVTGCVYECTTSGSGAAAKWTYKGSIKGKDASVDAANVISALGFIPVIDEITDTDALVKFVAAVQDSGSERYNTLEKLYGVFGTRIKKWTDAYTPDGSGTVRSLDDSPSAGKSVIAFIPAEGTSYSGSSGVCNAYDTIRFDDGVECFLNYGIVQEGYDALVYIHHDDENYPPRILWQAEANSYTVPQALR